MYHVSFEDKFELITALITCKDEYVMYNDEQETHCLLFFSDFIIHSMHQSGCHNMCGAAAFFRRRH